MESAWRICVVVPVYNHGLTVGDVIRGSSQAFAVIAVDDGSTDPEAIRVFSEQQHRYPQFRFIRQANAGPGAARNRALAEARSGRSGIAIHAAPSRIVLSR